MKTILAIDIGNTSTTLGLVRGQRVFGVKSTGCSISKTGAIQAAVREACRGKNVTGAVIASVVPRVVSRWCAVIRRELGCDPLVVSHQLALGIPVDYPRPATIGADRLANAAGGMVRYGAPLIIADFGTAVTFDVVHPRRGYIGGVIAPGLPLMFDYLAEKTALLPHLSVRKAENTIGRSTREAMQLGAHWGYRGMVREIIAELKRQRGFRNATLCATGGYAGWVVEGMKPRIAVDGDLTLFGLGCIYDLNRS